MAPKPKPKNKTEEKRSRQEGKPQSVKNTGVADEAPVPGDGIAPDKIPSVSPLPLVTGKEAVLPLQQGEHQFVSIANGPPIAYHFHEDAREQQFLLGQETRSDRGAPSNLEPPLDPQSFQQPQQQIIQIQNRIQRVENVLDDPLVPTSPRKFQRYGGSSYDCYFREELDHQHELCENCKEIWRRWPIRPPPPPEIDPYKSLLCVGDIDPHFEPARGDIVIYHPLGPQSIAGLRTGWGFLSSYKGIGDLRLHPNDLVVRLGSFSDSQNVVNYIPYDRVEVRVRTQSLEWRFLGGQVGLIRKPPTEPPGATVLRPVPVVDGKDKKKGKKGKKDKQKAERKEQGTTSGEDSPRKEKQPDKAKAKEGKKDKKNKKDRKGGKRGEKGGKPEDNEEGPGKGLQPNDLPEFTLDEIPDVFDTIPKIPDTFALHPGEKALNHHHPSLTCNYRYNKPGMKCGMGELVPQFGDIIIHEPQAWIHDDWGDRKKRPKGSMVKWYKPAPWRREFRKGMILLRPYIDRDIRLDIIPQCPYTPMMWSQWGGAELYVYEGKVASKDSEPVLASTEVNDEASKSPDSGAEKDNGLSKGKPLGQKDRKRDQKPQKGEKTNDAEVPKSGPRRGAKAETTDGKALRKGDKKAGKEKPKSSTKDTENIEREEDKTNPDNSTIEGGLWTYWGRSTHIFDRPFKTGALDGFCPERHQAGARNVVHLDFFVEDTGAESDVEHAPKVKNDLPSTSGDGLKGKKGKTAGKKGKKAPDNLKDSKQPKKPIK